MQFTPVRSLAAVSATLAAAAVSHAAIVDGLVRHYTLDDPSGATEAVDATSTKNLTLNAQTGGALPTPGVAGKIGGAWDFEADNQQFLDEGDDIWGAATAVTAAMWVNPESLTAKHTLFSEDDNSDDALLQLVDGGKVQWTLELSPDRVVTTDAAVVGTGAWTHIAVTFAISGADSTMRIYVNGAEVKAETFANTNAVDTVNDLLLGSFDDALGGEDHFDGLLDDVGFWNRELSADEVLGIYTSGNAGLDISQAVVPEPVSLALAGIAAVMLSGRRRT